MSSVHGFVQPGFERVHEAFARNFDNGMDIGASFCVTRDGETIVDLWGGYADAAKTIPWAKDTIVNVYSTTKVMTSLVMLMLADRGLIDFDAPVARYWPEFATNGKANVKLSHVMSHTSGLSGWKEPITKHDLYDWEKMTSLLAAQAPFWEPGTGYRYHALTQGYVLGEIVRRVTGKSVGTLFREEIAVPLNADFWIGLPDSEDHRVAELIPPPPGQRFEDGTSWDDIQTNIVTNPGLDISETKTRAWRGAEIPACGGTGNARAVAEIQAILANGGVAKGKRFLSEAGCRKALEVQFDYVNEALNARSRFGMGFGLSGGDIPMPNPNSLFWGGYGGSLIIIDMDTRMTIAYVMNVMQGLLDNRAMGLATAVWECLSQ